MAGVRFLEEEGCGDGIWVGVEVAGGGNLLAMIGCGVVSQYGTVGGNGMEKRKSE